MRENKRPFFTCRSAFAAIFCLLAISGVTQSAFTQSLKVDRDRGREMLKTIKEDIKKTYYDSAYHGMDVDARFKVADEKIKNATSNSQIFSIIAQALVDLDDSHTFFLPPDRVARVDYGWRMQMIGDTCYVVAVKPGSDAEAKGLRVGETVYSIDGYEPTRDNLWKIQYSYYTLKPRPGMRVVVQGFDNQLRQLDLLTKIIAPKERNFREEVREAKLSQRPQYYEIGNDLIVCNLPRFNLSEKEVDEMMKRIGNHKSLIFDLRGNPGGYEITLKRLVGYFFDRDLKIADLKGRREMKPLVAKTRGNNIFKGQLAVLVDSRSASASEIFARVAQIEKRGIVIGDRTAGAVMRGRMVGHAYERGVPDSAWLSFYGASITEADGIMADGKSLEYVGVLPDELLLPTAADLAAHRDPVLARAAAQFGIKISAAKAGALFSPEQKTEVIADDEENEEK